MSKRKNIAALPEALESRLLFSGSKQVMAYLPDYEIANGNSIYSESSNGTVTDNVQWSHLSQINYFSIEPDYSNGTSDGGIQSTTEAGKNPGDQLPDLVSHASAHGVKVFVTVGGGDTTVSIPAMNALMSDGTTNAERDTFAANLKSFCNQYGLAGVDLDWEPTSTTTDSVNNFAQLIGAIKGENLTVTADVLASSEAVADGDPGAGANTYIRTVNSTAISELNAINVEAYYCDASDASTYMNQWSAYVGTSNTSKLLYGIEVDDTNSDSVISAKVSQTASDDYAGLFLWTLTEDTGFYVSDIGNDLTSLGYTIGSGSGTGSTTGTVSGSVATSSGTGVSGVTVYLDANNNSMLDSGELHTTTAANGSFSFAGVPAGAYVVRQILPSGDTQTSPSNGYGDHVTVTAGSTASGENFVDTVPSAVTTGGVSGTVSSSSGGVGGITVYLDANNDSQLDNGELSTTTAANGTYSFSSVTPGAYVVRQELPSGYSQLSPSNGYGDHVTVSAGKTVSGENFTDQLPAAGGTISGSILSGGKGLAGVTVYLDANNNSVLDSGERSTATDASGDYSFTGVPAGAYIIRQILPSGQKQTSPSSGYGIHITLGSGGTLSNENFTDTASSTSGNTASISGNVFNDANGDGSQSNTEAGLLGWTVYIDTNNDGELDDGEMSTTTDSDGNYSFSGLAAGTYIIRVVEQGGYKQTLPSGGLGHHITVTAGQKSTGVQFGEEKIS